MKETFIYKTIPLEDSKEGSFTFAIITEPYGEKSPAVVSICAHLSDTEQWLLHIPMKQVKEVCKALKCSKSALKAIKKEKKKKLKKIKKEEKKANCQEPQES